MASEIQPENSLTRRSILRMGAVGAGAAGALMFLKPDAATAVPVGAPVPQAPVPQSVLPAGPRVSAEHLRSIEKVFAPDAWVVRPFRLSEVSLESSVFIRARDQALNLARSYPVDRFLAVFRRNAGLDVKGAQPPGGWEGFGAGAEEPWGPTDYPGKEAPRANLLRGHYAGHFLSMLALSYASTGELALKEKLDSMVAGLEECRAALAATGRFTHPGFFAAYGEWQFSQLEKYALYGEIWAPYYTCHKILAGLLDCYRLAGSEQALTLARGLGDWVHSRLSQCSQAQLARMWGIYIAGEYGGMNESMMDLYAITDDAKYRDTAKFFDLDTLVDACADNVDVLNKLHANQHVPQFPGYSKIGDDAEDGPRYHRAVENFWTMIVPGRSFAHGGTGKGEMWGPANTVAGNIGERNAEGCAAYNMLKISRLLFFHNPEAKYMDYYERTVLNHVLGSRRDRSSATSPEVLYMFPVNAGAKREYNNNGTCCGGTGLENHVKYQDSIYFHSKGDQALYVNLYIASTLNWAERGFKITQETAYPHEGVSRLTVDGTGPLDIMLRVPSWARGYSIAVNGTSQEIPITPGSYARLSRDWVPGDKIEVTIPLDIRVEATIDDPNVQTIFQGPVVMLATDSTTKLRKLSLYSGMSLDGGFAKGFTDLGKNRLELGDRTFEPCYSGRTDAYHMYFQRSEPTIVFAGVDSKVANSQNAANQSFLDVLWANAPFASRNEFLAAVQTVSQQFVDEGAMIRRDRQKVLVAAGKARL